MLYQSISSFAANTDDLRMNDGGDGVGVGGGGTCPTLNPPLYDKRDTHKVQQKATQIVHHRRSKHLMVGGGHTL